ncbi:hypothetical protein LSH36_1523g00037 [Paralvinella palmiformis]|uniref:Uncharacterized protein n=1 Tax=Paralvinella palmiformis TaxID=53620 RepID=A0AAD9MQG2_9ANNE|nr:hypothetical protein LSH36_1523g00037 [Paralvinella palmiformis]
MRIYNESFTKQVLEGNSERSVKHRIADFLLRYRSTPHGLVQDCRADICFVMDESGSIGAANWTLATQFVANFIDHTTFGETATKFGIVKFNNTANLVIPLNKYIDKDSLMASIRALPYHAGGTMIDAGLRVAREQCFTTDNGDRGAEYAPNILILMTDGISDKTAAVEEANLARKQGITIISIGIAGYELNTLKEIANSLDGERLFTYENFKLLLKDVSLILGESCLAVRDCGGGQFVQLTGDDKPTDLYFFSSLPITCNSATESVNQCTITLDVSTTSNRIAMYQPSKKDISQIYSCGFKLFYEDWKVNEGLAYDEDAPLQLLAKRDPQSSKPMSVILRVNVDGLPGTAFRRFQSDSITIFVHDQMPGICRISFDPWIKTFDRSTSYSAMQQGYFVYVRSNSIRKFEIQGRHFPCTKNGTSGCSVACAVIVREGKHVFAIDTCNENKEIHVLKLTINNRRQVNEIEIIQRNIPVQTTTNSARSEYMIKTAGGARVVATAYQRGIDIQITLSARDYRKTSGLCGTFDNNPSNDFIPKNEITSINDSDSGEFNQFIESWRISKEQSLFMNNIDDDNTDDMATQFCNCADKKIATKKPIDGAECGMNALENPISDIDNPREYVRALIPSYIRYGEVKRKKRESYEEEFRTDDVTDYVLTDYPDTTDNWPLLAWSSGSFTGTEAEARQACVEAIDSSPAISSCSQVKDTVMYSDMIDTCVKDIQRTGSLEWAVRRRRQFEQICVAMIITQNVTDRHGNLTEMMMNKLTAVTNVLCPSNCSNNGRCVNRTCQCFTDYLGADCSIKKAQVPVLRKYLMEDGCDVTYRECRATRVVVDGAANSRNLTCKITITKPNDGGTLEKTYPGQLETPTLVRCPLPSVSEAGSNVVGYSYKVQISNDRLHYSTPLQKFNTVLDSKCTVCVNNKCSQKVFHYSSSQTECSTKVAMETVNIQLEASYSTINVVYSTRGTSSGVNISSTGVMTWTSNNPSQNITVRLALKNCPQIQYTDVTLTLIIHTCNEICGMNAVCIRNVNTPPGDSNYTCSCRDDSRTYCHPNACPPNVPCENMTCGYKCDYPTATWSEWSPYTSCNKSCDYGLKERNRTCLGSPCFGEVIDIVVCNSFNCPEIESQKNQSIILEFQRISVKKIILKRKVIHSFIAAALNDYCGKKPDICCRAVGFSLHEI